MYLITDEFLMEFTVNAGGTGEKGRDSESYINKYCKYNYK